MYYIDSCHIERHKILDDLQSVTEYSQNNYDTVIDSHLDGYDKTYGWTAKVIEKKANRKLEYMAKEVGYLSYSPIYKLACNFVHSTSLGIASTNVEKPADDFTDLFLNNSIEFISDHLVTLAKNISIPKLNYIIILNTLYHIKDDLLKS